MWVLVKCSQPHKHPASTGDPHGSLGLIGTPGVLAPIELLDGTLLDERLIEEMLSN